MKGNIYCTTCTGLKWVQSKQQKSLKTGISLSSTCINNTDILIIQLVYGHISINGIFKQIKFSAFLGEFIDCVDKIKAHFEKIGTPNTIYILRSQEIQTKILLGDRKLAIWQGQRSYHFANPCQCPFVYYQYNSDENLSNIEMTHPAVTFLKFILGGNGNKRQPGFSEQFKLVTFSTQSSAYKKPKSINNNCIIIKSKDSEQRQQKDDLVLKDLVEMAINFHQNIPTEDGINELMDQILVHGITYSELILRIGNCQDGLDLVTYNVPTYSYEQCQCQSFQEYLTQEQNIQKILCFLWISKKDQTAFHDSTVNR